MNKKRKFAWVLLSILWVGFIFYNSSQNDATSNEKSRKIIREIKDKLFKYGNMNNDNNENSNNQGIKKGHSEAKKNKKVSQRANLAIRKIAHAFEYFVLAILLSKTFFAFGVKGREGLGYILFMVILCAVLDESYQLSVQGRSSSIIDVLIDFSGGLLGILSTFVLRYLWRKRKKYIYLGTNSSISNNLKQT